MRSVALSCRWVCEPRHRLCYRGEKTDMRGGGEVKEGLGVCVYACVCMWGREDTQENAEES